MKKMYIFLICFILVILVIVMAIFYKYRTESIEINNYNADYEELFEKEVYGNEVATIINKAVDNNEKNNIEKDEKGFYIGNDTNSVSVDIKLLDGQGQTYKMEIFYNGGIEEFVQYYGEILFKCTNIQYNSQKKVRYLLFEQISQ